MNNPAASCGVSNTQTKKSLVASHGELNPERLKTLAGWNTRSAPIDLPAVGSPRAEAKACETDKALKEILEKIGN